MVSKQLELLMEAWLQGSDRLLSYHEAVCAQQPPNIGIASKVNVRQHPLWTRFSKCFLYHPQEEACHYPFMPSEPLFASSSTTQILVSQAPDEYMIGNIKVGICIYGSL